MLFHETKIRVRYADTDKMGYVYYGKYTEYFEVGRTELIRSLGIAYKEMEERGIMLPVSEMSIKYYRPAVYDDLLTIRTSVKEFPNLRFITHYEILNEKEELLVTGVVQLVFVDMAKNRPVRSPQFIMEYIKKSWKSVE